MEILNSVRDHPRTAVRSCTTAGKTEIASSIALWFLYCFYPSTVITTAPTFRQVKSIIWKKIRAQHRGARCVLGGDPLETELKLDEKWFAMGISTKEPDRLQGYHNINFLVVIDEAPGVSQDIFDAVENVMASGGNVRILMLGNPSALSGEFHAAFHSKREIYNLIHITAYDTPNVKAGRIIIPGLITSEWIEERRKIWGPESPLFLVKVEGSFPKSETDTLIPVDWVERAVFRLDEVKAQGDAVIGCDPARYGEDETVIAVRRGSKIVKLICYNGMDTMQTVGNIIQVYNEYRPAKIRVDSIGIGAGVVDRLAEQNYPVEGINVGEVASDSEMFVNLRSELWWKLREELDPNNENALALPRDDILLGQLTSVKFKVSSTRGKIQIESKEEMKKRGLRSPDRAEAIMLTLSVGSHGGGFLDWMKQEVKERERRDASKGEPG